MVEKNVENFSHINYGKNNPPNPQTSLKSTHGKTA